MAPTGRCLRQRRTSSEHTQQQCPAACYTGEFALKFMCCCSLSCFSTAHCACCLRSKAQKKTAGMICAGLPSVVSGPPSTSPLTASSEMRRLTERTWPSSTKLKVHASHMCGLDAASASSVKMHQHAFSGARHLHNRKSYAMPAAGAYDGPALSCKLSEAAPLFSSGLLFQTNVAAA